LRQLNEERREDAVRTPKASRNRMDA
jgi:hypothetical protein